MAKPIGRVWISDNLLSGYVLFAVGDVQPIVIKFGAHLDNADGEECVFLYPSKKDVEVVTQVEATLQEQVISA